MIQNPFKLWRQMPWFEGIFGVKEQKIKVVMQTILNFYAK